MAMLSVVIVLLVASGCFSYPEQGIFEAVLTKDKSFVGFPKSMFKKSTIKLQVSCTGKEQEGKGYKVEWMLRWTPCSENYMYLTDEAYEAYFNNPSLVTGNEEIAKYQKSDITNEGICGTGIVIHIWQQSVRGEVSTVIQGNATASNKAKSEKPDKEENKGKQKRQAKDEEEGGKDKAANEEETGTTANKVAEGGTTSGLQRTTKATVDKNEKKSHVVATTWEDGMYLFIVHVSSEGDSDLEVNVHVEMSSSIGYISAVDYPLLIFYGVMCIVYCLYSLMWLCCSACQWRDLLRIQFWIGGVILLGLLEKAVFYGEYQHINSNGVSVSGAVVFAELVSCLKRTLARMLVIIVSLGFGIVKPRLGPMLHRVLGVGALYFILGAIEGCLRSLRPKQDPSKQALLASIPLAVLDAAICWWIFTSLVQTTRTLRLRRNVVKLSLYRHFTNTLIFCVIAALVFMVWSIKAHRFTDCLTDWKELWIDEAYWHLLFVIVLLVITILWRPTANNQRYAFSPLTDMGDEEEDEESKEPMMNDAFEGMKMRGVGGKSNGSPRAHTTPDSKAEADLKWVEEHIPQSVADAALPSLLDSDEEIMTTKFEMNKME
ncbi:transmembrane protein 87A-like [Ptychodera flava]|uniref:transmembrane protein 87A-like n=1 Tax=Ptychodera flava TaxID=63121 RepID=UPI003969C844